MGDHGYYDDSHAALDEHPLGQMIRKMFNPPRAQVSEASKVRLEAALERKRGMDGRSKIDKQIDTLTETLSELQEKKRLRAPLEVLYTLQNGAVVYFEMTFPRSVTTYVFSAVLTDEVWYTTAQQGDKALTTDTLVERLDHAQEIVLLQPFQRTLRTSRTVLEGDVQEVKEG